jgi:alanine-glyoxylate transaminase/serine-glyoxylate transaminase/serine-pyruvate transaminase
VPKGVDDGQVRQRLLSEYGIEIAGGFGQLAGKVFRIGLMGYSSTEENVGRILDALQRTMP